MDVLLDVLDTFLLDRFYATILPKFTTDQFQWTPTNDTEISNLLNERINRYMPLDPSKWATESLLPRDHIVRQFLSLFAVSWLFALILYYLTATISFHLVFDKRSMKHPKFLRNQIQLEKQQAYSAIPVMAALTAPFFVAEVRDYTKLYDFSTDAPFPLYTVLQFPLFILFTDFGIYWVHRGLHHPWVYKNLHKPHHKWIISTPFASYAFHPLDGWAQSVSYHVYPFIFPLQKWAYLALFMFVTIWTVMIHDGEYAMNSPIVNGSACHTIHHYYFNYNYGQYTTLWDRLGGSYRKPDAALFNRETRMKQSEIDKQVKEMNRLVKEIEGTDERCYETGAEGKKVR
ncbi:putative sterol delta 5,6-desaturase [Aspergillus taichungensis]|uniref:Putative sterol delta 5,6-desaturase n=1 Tax=Aspergillus taichungensis TaxID=482145 RepID=A0A2J5HPJ3_9EURO|nr:putative sterol delta 5,6-desaturase [Aspergillus taichungensis]